MDDIFSYIMRFGVIAIIIYFFINKSTRKTAFRILKISIVVIAVITGVCALCIYLLGIIGILIGGFICLDIYISWIFISAVKEQIYITKLHKKGCRTNGTLINVVYGVRGGRNDIRYQADGKDYEFINGLNVGKWEVGYNKIPVLYDPERPENSCLEKDDLVSAVNSTITISLLEIVLTGSIIYSIIYLI